MESNFDKVAGTYDGLARLIFGNSIKKSQVHFLNRIPDSAKVLIVGGGTGWILEELGSIKENLSIDYVDSSNKMMELSKSRNAGGNHVNFIKGSYHQIQSGSYDTIITNFFLDVFDEVELASAIEHFTKLLSDKGIWICTDFQKTGRLYHKVLLWSMHRFFNMLANLQAKKLADFRKLLLNQGLQENERKEYFNGLIYSAIYSLS